MDKTKIEWCDSTWNPVTGCFHDCEYCYARRISERFGGTQKYTNIFDLPEPIRGEDGNAKAYPYSFSPTFHRYRLNDYIGKKGRNIFVCSMGDLFGDWVPATWIVDVIEVCMKNNKNNYLFLTKNPKRYEEPYIPRGFYNFWFGTTITRKCEIERVYEITGFRNSFVSIEPILEDLELRFDIRYFRCLGWVIIGAETGHRKNKVVPKREWIEKIVNECRKAGIPVFMKSSPGLAEIWGEPLIQEFPKGLMRKE